MSETAIALGFFDGVHIAHKNIILSAVEAAREKSLEALVLTFDKSPREHLKKGKTFYLTSAEEKKRLCNLLGADLFLLSVTDELLKMEAEDFVREYLVKKYSARHITCGFNYRFGCGGRGTPELLCELGKKYGFTVNVMPCIEISGKPVSSSRIRELIEYGKIEEANKLLGRCFSASGKVIRGKQLGKKLGFPTANVTLGEKTVIPKKGVYKTRTVIDNIAYESVTNVGTNPTVGDEALRTETYIKGFEGSIYEKEIKIEFISFIREEKQFSSVEALKKQIESDVNSN